MSVHEKHVHTNADGKAHIVLEKAHIVLKDLSAGVFKTDDLAAFGAFAAAKAMDPGMPAVFYDAASLELWPTVGLNRTSAPMATCALAYSPALAFLKTKLGKVMSIADLERALNTLRRNGPFLTVISQLKNLVVSKETKYERQVDNQANFKLLVERKGGTGDWTPPATLTFSVPVFAYLEDLITVEADLVMTMKDEDGGAPTFTLEALTFEEDLKNRQREILEQRIGKYTTVPKYWGSHRVQEATDGYLYKDVGAQL